MTVAGTGVEEGVAVRVEVGVAVRVEVGAAAGLEVGVAVKVEVGVAVIVGKGVWLGPGVATITYNRIGCDALPHKNIFPCRVHIVPTVGAGRLGSVQ